jgi:tetratricopeptide (TPR) repeat protein
VSDDNVFKMVEMLTQLTIRSLDHIMARIHREAENAGRSFSEFTPFFLDSQWNRVRRLVQQAVALPEAQAKAADLVPYVDRLVSARGYFTDWLPVVRNLAVALDVPGVDNKLQVARLWSSVARCYQYAGDANRAAIALSYAERHTEGHGEAGDDFLRGLRLTKGGIRIEQLHYEDAEALFRQLLGDAEAVGDSETALFGHDLAAYYYLNTYQPERAFDHAQQAFVLAIARRDLVRRLRGLHCMAEALRYTKQFGQADRYLQMAYEQAEKLNDQPWLAYLEYCFGALAVDTQDYPRAISQLRKARSMFQGTSNRPGEVSSIETLGFALMRAGQYEEAEDVLLEAIRGLKEIRNPFELAQTHYGLGMVYAQQGWKIQAKDAWYEALHQLDALRGDQSHVLGLQKKIQEAVTGLSA